MGNKIDVRALRLDKLYVPKTFDIEEPDYVAVGYFDAVQLRGELVDSKFMNPFMSGYKIMVEWKNEKKKKLMDYNSQEQMLFTDICEDGEEDGTSFSEETIHAFWEDKSCPYLFMSMVHINHIGNLKLALKTIKEKFNKDYLCYISFDYCDIIIFAKKLKTQEFLDKIKSLFMLREGNAEAGSAERKKKEEGAGGKDEIKERVIVDTFSMISFNFKCRNQSAGEKQKDGYGDEEFLATINLSVKDYAGFEEWCGKNRIKESGMKLYKMYGRHDISIINEKASAEWLMNILEKLYLEENQGLFWTFEIYVKVVPDEITNVKPKGEMTRKVYESVKSELEEKIEDLRCVVERAELINKPNFLLPIYEVRDCICSILKNTFAEEFIYCMYESFRHFIVYMTDEIAQFGNNMKIREENIADCYDSYFTALNTLVNSTMHSERQFIQATAFNAIFYTVPPKIMAFYNAYIYRMKQILEDKGCREQYTYLIYPSFSPIMYVRKISLRDKPPCDRIITVRINERTLYDVSLVVCQIVHELAHYSGNRVRCREIRLSKMMYSFLEVIISKCGIKDKKTVYILKEYVDENWAMDKQYGFMEEFSRNSERFFKDIINDTEKKILHKFEQCYGTELEDDDCDPMLYKLGIEGNDSQKTYRKLFTDQYCRQKYEDFRSKIRALNEEGILRVFHDSISLLENVYRECYADLQMILVLAVNPEDYLNIFIIKQDVRLEDLFSELENKIRISIIFKVLVDCGIWEKETFCDSPLKSVMGWISRYNEKDFSKMDETEKKMNEKMLGRIQSYVGDYKMEAGGGIRFCVSAERKDTVRIDAEQLAGKIDLGSFTYVTYGLYEYLLNVTEVSMMEYRQEDKREKIREAREIIRAVLDFERTTEVYNCIEREIYAYKDILVPLS